MIPAVFSRFEIEISCLQGVTGALRAQPLAVSLRPYEPLRYVGRRPRVAFFFLQASRGYQQGYACWGPEAPGNTVFAQMK